MLKELTIKDIKEIMLEAQSHSGLPYYQMYYLVYLTFAIKKLALIEETLNTKDEIINNVMIYYHNHKRNPNKNIKSYDW